MKKLSKALTDYIISNGMIDEEDRNIYEYGFMITVEVGLFIVFSLFMMLYLHMFAEGVLFFLIFVPLRSYAGGLHLDKYYSCFILSCLTFSGILLLVKYIQVSVCVSLASLLVLEIMVYKIYPVENINREVDNEEDRYFRKRLKSYLIFDIIIALGCVVLKKDRYIFLITIVFLMVVVTMFFGKCKNRIVMLK